MVKPGETFYRVIDGAQVPAAPAPAAAEPVAGSGFRRVEVAETPDETGMLNALNAALGKPPSAV